jgi:HAD superfamily hydrolase (TIGR01509 family)
VIRGVIFDLDGTIIDNEGLYGRAFCSVLKKLEISCEEVKHTPGIGVRENWERMKRDLNLASDPEELAAQTQQFYLDHLGEVKPRADLNSTVHFIRDQGRKVILATSNTGDIGSAVLDKLGIKKLFSVVVFGDDVERKKPAPDIFLKALHEAKLRPQETLIVEDSPAGIEAAKAANIKVAAIKTNQFNRIQLARAHHIIGSLGEVKDLI